MDLIAEYDTDGNLRYRYVHGTGADEPLVWYNYTGSSVVKKYFVADERGSIVGMTDENGNLLTHYSYDAYGVPSSPNDSPFQYTGQVWIPEFRLYYYKARLYSPTLGRFRQNDPIGYGDGMNMYAYVGGDFGATDRFQSLVPVEHVKYITRSSGMAVRSRINF